MVALMVESWHGAGQEPAGGHGRVSQQTSEIAVLRSGSRVAISPPVSAPSERRPVCHDWEALKDAIQRGQTTAYEFDGRELHVWRENPERGERCQCGARTWI